MEYVQTIAKLHSIAAQYRVTQTSCFTDSHHLSWLVIEFRTLEFSSSLLCIGCFIRLKRRWEIVYQNMHFAYNSPDFFHFPRSNFIPKNQSKITINTSPTTTCQQLMIKQLQRRTITHTPSTHQQISNNHPLRTPDKETRTFKVCVFSDHLAFNFSDCSDVKVTGNGNSKDCEWCSKAKCKVP